jgi:hypothetical protein
MAKLNLNIPMLDENGEVIMEGRTLGLGIGAQLLQTNFQDENDIIKFFGWAGTLSRNEELELDKADAAKLKEFIINDPNLYLVSKAPALELIDKLKF